MYDTCGKGVGKVICGEQRGWGGIGDLNIVEKF